MSQDAIDQMRINLGLDKSIVVRYAIWMKGLVQGNLGYSHITYLPVGQVIAERIGPTLELMGISLLISIVIGIILGVISALKQYTVLDYVLTVLGFIGRSIPVFFVGMLLIYFFALKFNMLRSDGFTACDCLGKIIYNKNIAIGFKGSRGAIF